MRVDHQFKDGDTIRLGPLALTAHITGGHTRGCTSWSFHVRDGDRVLNVVSACDLGRLATSQYPEQEADLERSFRARLSSRRSSGEGSWRGEMSMQTRSHLNALFLLLLLGTVTAAEAQVQAELAKRYFEEGRTMPSEAAVVQRPPAW
jgi:hypothetical protein